MLEEDSFDYRNIVVGSTKVFLDGVVTPPVGRVQLSAPPPEFNEDIDTDNNNPVTMVKNTILPLTFSVYSQIQKAPITFMLLLNPTTLNYGNTNAVQATYTRQGYVTQLWGPNLMMLSSTGKAAAFMVATQGITNFFERRSIGYRNLMALVAAYKSNGYILVDPTNTSANTRVIQYAQGIEMTYDGNTFLGHFNNFTLDDTADHPFCINYSFEFIIDAFSGDYSEIRGHFTPIPGNSNLQVSDQSVDTNRLVDYTSEVIIQEAP